MDDTSDKASRITSESQPKHHNKSHGCHRDRGLGPGLASRNLRPEPAAKEGPKLDREYKKLQSEEKHKANRRKEKNNEDSQGSYQVDPPVFSVGYGTPEMRPVAANDAT